MKKNPNSVFTFPYTARYYLTHPWKWFKQCGLNLRSAWLRCTKGWCPWDVWDWDYWFMTVVPQQFRYLAQHGMAYPGREPFETPEKWHEWLNDMADLIETGKEEWQDEHNEYYEKYIEQLTDKLGNLAREHTELDDNYFARVKELSAQGDKNIRFALDQIAEHFYSLWD